MTLEWFKKNKSILILFMYAVLCLPVFFGVIQNGLDPSYQYLLNKLTDLENMRFGRDVVFTYGILGFLAWPLDFGFNHLIALGVYGILFAGQLYSFYHLMLKGNENIVRVILVLVLFFFGQPAYYTDLFLECSAIIALLLLWKEEDNWIGLLHLSFATVIAFFYKFSLAIPIIASFCIFLLSKLLQKKVKQLWRIFVPIICIPIFYLIYNPSISDFLKYVKGSWEVAEGFNSAMSSYDGSYDNCIFWIIVLMILYVVIMVMQLITKNNNNFWLMLCIAPELFFGYKHAIVRADSAHYFWGYVEIICMLALLATVYEVKNNNEGDKLKRCRQSFVFGFIFFALLNYVSNINPWELLLSRILSLPSAVYAYTYYDIDIELSNMKGFSDNLVAYIGDESFTTYPWEITAIEKMGVASNNYVCLPCMQMYSCYTPYLDEITAELFEGEGPEYILMNFDAIDERLPLFEAPATWKSIIFNYEYVDTDGNYILLKKMEEPTEVGNYSEIYESSISKYETLNINDYSEISIDMELSFWGKIVKILWKIPEVTARIEFSNGEVAEGRVITDNLADGLLVHCMPTSLQYVQFISEGREIPSIVSVSFYGPGLRFYQDEIRYIEYKYL